MSEHTTCVGVADPANSFDLTKLHRLLTLVQPVHRLHQAAQQTIPSLSHADSNALNKTCLLSSNMFDAQPIVFRDGKILPRYVLFP